MAVQLQRPFEDVVAAGWTATPASPVTGWDKIDEAVPDDADYFSSGSAPSGTEPYETKLTSVSDPLSSSDHVYRYRLRKNTSGGARIDFVVELREAAIVIASWTHLDVTNTWTTFVQTLTALQADAITDYTNLRLRFVPTQV